MLQGRYTAGPVFRRMTIEERAEKEAREDTSSSLDKIKKIIPSHDGDEVIFFDRQHEERGREARKVVCLALVENQFGQTRVEPMVRGRGIVKPAEDRGLGGWLTTEAEEQLVTASRYMWTPDDDHDDAAAWAYAHKIDRNALNGMAGRSEGGVSHSLKEDLVR